MKMNGRREKKFRCPECGDSAIHRQKAHLSIRDDGVYHCFRCGSSGKLSAGDLSRIWPGTARLEEALSTVEKSGDILDTLQSVILPGPGSPRVSRLPRWHFGTDQGLVDVFESRYPEGILGGFHLRPTWDKQETRSVGARLLGFSGENIYDLPVPFFRIVEGPYDAIYPEDICLFGMPTVQQLDLLKAYPLIFCPDGDLWTDLDRAASYMKLLVKSRATIIGIEVLPYDKDPDEVPLEDRKFVPLHDRLFGWEE